MPQTKVHVQFYESKYLFLSFCSKFALDIAGCGHCRST